jgi:hypothetical protein
MTLSSFSRRDPSQSGLLFKTALDHLDNLENPETVRINDMMCDVQIKRITLFHHQADFFFERNFLNEPRTGSPGILEPWDQSFGAEADIKYPSDLLQTVSIFGAENDPSSCRNHTSGQSRKTFHNKALDIPKSVLSFPGPERRNGLSEPFLHQSIRVIKRKIKSPGQSVTDCRLSGSACSDEKDRRGLSKVSTDAHRSP